MVHYALISEHRTFTAVIKNEVLQERGHGADSTAALQLGYLHTDLYLMFPPAFVIRTAVFTEVLERLCVLLSGSEQISEDCLRV